jgi:hypothetical protein
MNRGILLIIYWHGPWHAEFNGWFNVLKWEHIMTTVVLYSLMKCFVNMHSLSVLVVNG